MLKLASVLPPREGFNADSAGAVALYVYHFSKCDPQTVDHTVIGGWHGSPFSGVSYQSISIPKFRLTSKSVAYARSVSRYLKNGKFDLVEVHNRPAIALEIKALCPEIKVALFIHNDPATIKELASSKLLKACLSSLDQFIAVSQFVADSLGRLDPKVSQKTSVVYNAIDADWFSTKEDIEQSSNTVRITYVGRIVPEKGVLETAEAFNRVMSLHQNIHCSMLGGAGFGPSNRLTPFERNVIELSQRSDKTFSYLGSQSNEYVLAHLAQSDIVVVPSKVQEAFGRVLIEAMSQSNACICSRSGALPEVGSDAVIVLEEVSADSIERAIVGLLDSPDKLKQLKLRAKQRAQEFSVLRCYPRLNEYRDELVFGGTVCNRSI